MTALTGTPRQIAWAEKIRSNMIANLQNENRLFWGGYLDCGADLPKILGRSVCDDRLKSAVDSIKDLDARRAAKRAEILKMADEAIELVSNEKSAIWFIEHR